MVEGDEFLKGEITRFYHVVLKEKKRKNPIEDISTYFNFKLWEFILILSLVSHG